MPDESRTPIIGDRIESRLDRLEQGQLALVKDVAELKGAFGQMDRRMASVESLQKWAIGLIITGILAVVGMSMTILSKLP